jgi:hypothetical protein
MRRPLLFCLTILALHVAAYIAFRLGNTEIWDKDKQAYVIFNSSALYYGWRPVSYVDGALTGMRFHIGLHR